MTQLHHRRQDGHRQVQTTTSKDDSPANIDRSGGIQTNPYRATDDLDGLDGQDAEEGDDEDFILTSVSESFRPLLEKRSVQSSLSIPCFPSSSSIPSIPSILMDEGSTNDGNGRIQASSPASGTNCDNVNNSKKSKNATNFNNVTEMNVHDEFDENFSTLPSTVVKTTNNNNLCKKRHHFVMGMHLSNFLGKTSDGGQNTPATASSSSSNNSDKTSNTFSSSSSSVSDDDFDELDKDVMNDSREHIGNHSTTTTETKNTTPSTTSTNISPCAQFLLDEACMCWNRFLMEFDCCYCCSQQPSSWFCPLDRATGRVLNVPNTFGSFPTARTLCWKIFAVLASLVTVVMGIQNVAKPGFYLAYLTHWSVSFCTIYLLLSLANTLLLLWHPTLPPYNPPDPTKSVSFRYMFTWIMFELGAHTAAGATCMFWPLQWFTAAATASLIDDNDDHHSLRYNLVANHGGVLLITLIDGMYINRIPFRIMHWLGCIVPIHCLYVLWTILHDKVFTSIGNPDRHDDDPLTNDDALYQGVLEWNTNWHVALSTSTSLVFALGPGLFLLFWYLSIYQLPSQCGIPCSSGPCDESQVCHLCNFTSENSSDEEFAAVPKRHQKTSPEFSEASTLNTSLDILSRLRRERLWYIPITITSENPQHFSPLSCSCSCPRSDNGHSSLPTR